jgi:predicted AlkP superfamily phosphohydrolase/phosphomutase
VMMVLYKLVDNLQHKAWRYLDPRTAGSHPVRAEISAKCFEELDRVLGDLWELARKHNAMVLIMSDHGHGSLDGKAQANLLLEQWGYLKINSRLTQVRHHAQCLLDRARGRVTKRFDANLGIEHELDLDWSSTKACVMHAGIYGFLYISLKGRQPGGLVDPADYERLRNDLRERYLKVTCKNPQGETIRVFPEVHKTEELYKCSRQEHPWLPDLLLVPDAGLAVVRKIRGSQSVRWSPPHRLEGTHRVEGILIVNGPHVRRGATIHANIADVTPTILAAVGLRVPLDMEGKAMEELFDTKLTVEFEPPQVATVTEHEEVYSEAEKQTLTKRLSELGYLE